jgi:hypothetical protein
MGVYRPALMSNGEIAAKYLAGMTITELALRCKVGFPIIRSILEAQHVPLRSHAEVLRLRTEDRRQRHARARARQLAGRA